MPSFRGEVKPSVPCHRFAACKRTLWFTCKLEAARKIDQPFLAQFRPSLTEVPHVAWHAAPLEMTEGTKGGAQRASNLRPRCFGEVDPETVTHIYLSNPSASTFFMHWHNQELYSCISCSCVNIFIVIYALSFNPFRSYVGPRPTLWFSCSWSFSSCSTYFSQQIAQVVLFLFLFFSFKTIG
jgi:hypothetical protein